MLRVDFDDLIVDTSILTLLVLVVENVELIGSYVDFLLPFLIEINLPRRFILLLKLQSMSKIRLQVCG